MIHALICNYVERSGNHIPRPLPLCSPSLIPSSVHLYIYIYISSIYIVVSFHIQTLKQMKDRERLRNYINQIPLGRQREFRGKICALVDNTVRYNYSSVLLSAGLTVFFLLQQIKWRTPWRYVFVFVFVCGIFICVWVLVTMFISLVYMLQLIAW